MDTQLPQNNDTLKRLENLERQNKKLKWIIIIMVVFVGLNIILTGIILFQPKTGRYQVVIQDGVLYRVDTTTGSMQLFVKYYQQEEPSEKIFLNEIGHLSP